jgi:uncharacterized protein (DUF4415 family)
MSKKIVRNWEEPVDDSNEENVEEEFRFDPEKARWNILPRGVRKVRVNIWLDDDVVAEFKARAEQPNAAPYQTQINQTLREALGKAVPSAKTQTSSAVAALENPQFIQGLAEKIGAYLVAHSSVAKRKRKAA